MQDNLPKLLWTSGILVKEALRCLQQFGTPNIPTAIACLQELQTRLPADPPPSEELITIREASDRLGCKYSALYQRIREKGIAVGYGKGGKVYVRWKDVLDHRPRQYTRRKTA